MIQPSDLGAPPHLATFRPEQLAAFNWLVASGRRVNVITAPPGVGKSHLGWAYARLMGGRAVFLTETNHLADQYTRTYPDTMVDIRGMGNYPCRALNNAFRCDAGPCLVGEKCPYREKGCAYFDREAEAAAADLVITNYSYWFAHPSERPTLGERDILICDEAHALPELVSRAAGATFSGNDITLKPEMESWDMFQWREWAHEKRVAAWERLNSKTLSPAQTRDVRRLLLNLTRLDESGAEDWAFDWQPGNSLVRTPHVTFEPVGAEGYTEPLLFRGVPRVLLMSATIREYHLAALGLQRPDYAMYEARSPFPIANRPIYWLEGVGALSAKSSQTALAWWVHKIDQVIDSRLDRKGIIHTHSYARAKFLKENSRHSQHMVLHDSQDVRHRVEAFKRASPPAILVSPVVHTGWDFPFDAARWQIIAKVPFDDTRRGIAHERQSRDRQYSTRQAVNRIMQMTGRVVRDAQDVGETIITDDKMNYLWSHYRAWFAAWFREAFRPVSVVPPPPALIVL